MFCVVNAVKRLRQDADAAGDTVERKRQKRRMSKAMLRQRRKADKQKPANKEHLTGARSKTSVVTCAVNAKGTHDKMVFSKFDFSEDSSTKKRKRSDDVATGRNYKALMKKAKKKEDALLRVAEVDKQQASEMTRKAQWKSALLKAEGVKLKDNAELLKRSMKRRQQQKKSSERKWNERAKTLQSQMKNRQEKRIRNIAKKKEARHEKRIDRAKKRGRVVVN